MAETTKSPATLAGRLNRYKPDQAVNIIRELCAQLEGDSDSFHGGIWPGNVRLDPNKTAILGAASDTPVSQRPADEVEFLAPEYFWDGTKSASADVYSLALLLYAMCNRGRMPFQPKNKTLTDTDRSAALRRRMKGETIPVTGKLSRSLKDVLTKALSYDPEKRYISAAEFLSALSDTEEAQPPVTEDAVLPAATEEPAAPAAEDAVAEADAADAPAEELIAEEPAEEAVPAEFAEEPADEPIPEEPAAETEAEELTETPDAVELPAPEPESGAEAEEALDKTPDVEPTPAASEAVPTPKAEPEHRKYTVQKDFEEAMPRSRANPVPTSRRKKRVSPLVPVLCILAVGIILVVALTTVLGTVNDNSKNDLPEPTSEPYVITPSEVEAENSKTEPETAESTAQPEAETDPEESQPEDSEATESDANPGSSTIDGMTVEATNDVVYVTQSGAKLRTGPSTSYDVADSLSRDTELIRTGIVNGWSQVQYNDSEYYISNALISSQTTEGSDTDTTSSGDGIGSLKVSSEANVRAGAGTGYDVLGVARVGTGLTITDVTDDGKWYQVSFNGQTGYINRNMVTVEELDYSATARVTGDVNVRSGPGTNYTKLGVAKAGETLTVTGITSGNWYQISFNGETGYVAGNFISIQ